MCALIGRAPRGPGQESCCTGAQEKVHTSGPAHQVVASQCRAAKSTGVQVLLQNLIRSTSSSEISSLVRSYSLVVRGDWCAAIC
jgi:hypothetical protein